MNFLITGGRNTGKTLLANKLKKDFEEKGHTVLVINEGREPVVPTLRISSKWEYLYSHLYYCKGRPKDHTIGIMQYSQLLRPELKINNPFEIIIRCKSK